MKLDQRGTVLRSGRGRRPTVGVLWLLVLAALPLMGAEGEKSGEPESIELRGQVVCVAEALERDHGVSLPPEHQHVYAVKTVEGKYYTLLRTRRSEALFVDERLRGRELLMSGLLFPGTMVFEPSGSYTAFKDGKAYEIYYYCDVCVIETVAPGECLCCRQPTELVEEEVMRDE